MPRQAFLIFTTQTEQGLPSGKTEGDDLNWNTISTDEVLESLATWMGDGKVAVLAEKSFSTARRSLVAKLKDSGVSWFEHEPIDLCSVESELGGMLELENGLRLIPDFNKSAKILSLDSDFLGNREANSLSNTRSLMKGRKVLSPNDAKKMNRLYSVESDLTITGGVADHRLRLESSQFSAFASLLAAEIFTLRKKGSPELLKKLKSNGESQKSHLNWIKECAKDLCKKPKSSIVIPGSHLAKDVHLICYSINQELGAIGNTVNYIITDKHESNINDFAKEALDRKFDTLIILGGNPMYNSKLD